MSELTAGTLDAYRQRISELEAERDNLFDRLHIESLVREWCAPLALTHSHVDGLCDVLRMRLARAAIRARPAPQTEAGSQIHEPQPDGLYHPELMPGFREGAEVMRDKCAEIADGWAAMDPYGNGHAIGASIAAAIRALPLPMDDAVARFDELEEGLIRARTAP